MRKQLLTITAIAAAVALQSCGGEKAAEKTEAAAEEVKTEAEVASWNINTENSTVMWEGGTAGAMVYSHSGNIDVQSGSLATEGEALAGGIVTIDLMSIMPTDSGYSEEHPKTDLIGHLQSPDFFDTENHPTATFEVTGAEGNNVMGKLTVRGKTNDETLMVQSMEMKEDGTAMIKGSLIFDRQKYDVKWEHYVQDVILSDEIKLDFEIMAEKA